MRIISLFCGAGGMDLGFERAGHRVVWAIDNDPDAVKTFQHNIRDCVVEGDIGRVDLDELPSADLVIGGFPCQGFSTANIHKEDEDSRNELYRHFVRVLEHLEPKYFVAENVPGLLGLEDGAVMEMIIGDFNSAGYRVRHQVLNAADFGVPQKRRRVIILGTRKDLPREREPQYPEPTHAEEPGLLDREPWVTMGDVLKDIPEPGDDHDLKNHVYSKYKLTGRDFHGHRPTNYDEPSPTILARGDGGGGVCAIPHPKNHRRMSVRESAIMQSFPLDFEFFGSMTSMYRQVGNAVPPRLARHLGEEFAEVEKQKTGEAA